MSKKSRQRARAAIPGGGGANKGANKTENLRALRLAQEAASKEAGTWGDMTVGEILHEGSRSVFVQVWKGARRPDPFEVDGVRRAAPRGPDWLAVMAWIDAEKSDGFSRCIVAWDLSAPEARKIAESRIAAHRAAGYTVINPSQEAS